MAEESNDLFGKMLKGGTIDNSDPQMYRLWEAVAKTIELSAALNTSVNIDEIKRATKRSLRVTDRLEHHCFYSLLYQLWKAHNHW